MLYKTITLHNRIYEIPATMTLQDLSHAI